MINHVGMYIEDAIIRIATSTHVQIIDSKWPAEFTLSLYEQVGVGNNLSTRQVEFFVSAVLEPYGPAFVKKGVLQDQELQSLKTEKRCRNNPYESVIVTPEIRHLGNNLLGFRFKAKHRKGEAMRNHMRTLSTITKSWAREIRPRWSYRFRMWVVPVTSDNLKKVMRMVEDSGFGIDEGVIEFFETCSANVNQPSTAVIHDDQLIINIKDNDILAAWAKNVFDGEYI